MLDPFYVDEGNLIGIAEYRLKCLNEDQEGKLIEDEIEYPVDRWGNITGGKYPKCDDEYLRLLGEIVRTQIQKRKKERENA